MLGLCKGVVYGLCKDKVSASYPIQKSLTPSIRWK